MSKEDYVGQRILPDLQPPSAGSVPAPSIMAGVDDIIDHHLGCDIGSAPHYRHTASCLRLGAAPAPHLDAHRLLHDLLDQVAHNMTQCKRDPSQENWRFEPKTHIAVQNSSKEKLLEKRIVRAVPGWVNQVPTASGLASSSRDKHRNIDLVYQVDVGRYEFVELKIDADTPLTAAMELVQYFALFLFTRQTFPAAVANREMLRAYEVHLRVLAPQRYYSRYDLRWLERKLGSGIGAVALEYGVMADFAYQAFPHSFRWPCPDALLSQALATRIVPQWLA